MDANLRTADRVSIAGYGPTLAVRIADRDGVDPVTLSATDTVDTKAVTYGTRRVLKRGIGSESSALAVIYEMPDRHSDLVLGHWVIERDRSQPDGGVFGDSASCELVPTDRSDVRNYAGDGFSIVSVAHNGLPKSSTLFELEVMRFYANFDSRQVHADVLDQGGGRRVILTGRMSDDRTRFRGVVSTQTDGGVLVEVGAWGGMFCTPGALQAAARKGSAEVAAATAAPGDDGILVMTAAYEYEIDNQQFSTMAVMEAKRSAGTDPGDGGETNSAPWFGAQSIRVWLFCDDHR